MNDENRKQMELKASENTGIPNEDIHRLFDAFDELVEQFGMDRSTYWNEALTVYEARVKARDERVTDYV